MGEDLAELLQVDQYPRCKRSGVRALCVPTR